MPEVGEVTLELLQAMADRHQRATAEHAVFIVHPRVYGELRKATYEQDGYTNAADENLGLGFAGPNYYVFFDPSVLPEEVEIVK